MVLSTPHFIRSICTSSQCLSQLKIGIIGAAFGYGQRHLGVRNSPYMIRKKGLVEALQELGHDVKDFGNLDQDKVEKLSAKERLLKQSTNSHVEVGKFNEKV